ncbi:hypothetical protein HYQ45_014884 [Verticillium longisporum]|uniref:Uncharacterized protein n=1 Tax=Verticillium longisporum TaxID=100787 RepID=A0A0G4NCC4_VERLO|nr:hypothetical protein HYQ44_015991 [Verticillium longisporum]KAG7119706.1 hypothetical protein HYQ45_014884 [Verticillium longisporum]CRK44009.1 hypothetical protein BN1723_016294 [Verticillium longisporum]
MALGKMTVALAVAYAMAKFLDKDKSMLLDHNRPYEEPRSRRSSRRDSYTSSSRYSAHAPASRRRGRYD